MTVDIIKAELSHVPSIVGNIREIDLQEILFPEEVLEDNIKTSAMAWTGMIDNVPVCSFGVMTDGVVWLIGTDKLDKHPMTTLRHCRECIDAMHSMFPVLTAYVSFENEKSWKWLQWLGFELSGATKDGDNRIFCRMKKQSEITLDFHALQTDFRGAISRLEEQLITLPQTECGLVRRFCNGLYSREFFAPAGTFVITYVHKHENMSIIARGDVSIATEEGVSRVVGPAVFPTKAGTKRLIYFHEDTTWVTVHPLPDTMDENTPIETIDNYFACQTYKDFERVSL